MIELVKTKNKLGMSSIMRTTDASSKQNIKSLIKKVVLVVIITNRMINVTPVSYTHLDVYKRQIYNSFTFIIARLHCR